MEILPHPERHRFEILHLFLLLQRLAGKEYKSVSIVSAVKASQCNYRAKQQQQESVKRKTASNGRRGLRVSSHLPRPCGDKEDKTISRLTRNWLKLFQSWLVDIMSLLEQFEKMPWYIFHKLEEGSTKMRHRIRSEYIPKPNPPDSHS